jgi:opacity protein-like surface antigen
MKGEWRAYPGKRSEDVVMDWLRPFVVTSAVTLTLVGAGHAADVATLPPPVSVSPRSWPAPDYTPSNIFMSGWYVRADIGQRWNNITGADAAPGFVNPTTDTSGTGAAFSFGAGFRRDWIRADLTVDYVVPQKYQGTVVTPGDVTAKIQPDTALLNIYADLGSWHRLTPYIGAGIGATRVTVSDFNSAVTPPFTGAPDFRQWNLAWAAMAGTAFAISRNLQLDLGYRYLNFGNVQSSDGPGGHMTFRNVAAQEVRIGLRWSLDDLSGFQ